MFGGIGVRRSVWQAIARATPNEEPLPRRNVIHVGNGTFEGEGIEDGMVLVVVKAANTTRDWMVPSRQGGNDFNNDDYDDDDDWTDDRDQS